MATPASEHHPGPDIRQARQARGWSQNELAHHSGVGVRTIRRVEAGEGDPDSRTITRLRHTLGITPGTTSGNPDPHAVLRAVSDGELIAELARRLGAAQRQTLPDHDLRLPRRHPENHHGENGGRTGG